MEPYEIKTVRLELPYIKLAGTQCFSMSEAYKEPGFYFVESPQGDIALVLVPGLGLCPEVWGLPNALVSRISKLMAEAEVWKPTMDSMKDDINQLHEMISRLNDVHEENCGEVRAALSETISQLRANCSAVEEFKTAIEEFGQSKKKSCEPEGGYISEKTLIDIIDKVRK